VKVKRYKHNECQNGYVEWEGEQMGCLPSSCGRLCDKSELGFAADAHVMRAACTPFGMAISHCTLVIIKAQQTAAGKKRSAEQEKIINFASFMMNQNAVKPYAGSNKPIYK
jgi:hypothetical protein